ncbi:CHAT domain-containing protein [Streptomyces sp. S.PB5]|uniref:CHAT domain-containing protein n=1 Tax=Streptomyces sp. S.PB5 TaxID=3020844 RepID=UPI0025AF93AD|nr:CHAT domain-containing protein [Streptomyces sp. S.PB5]MDN3021837.1 CHAT domain-containing protein [Streptomyces sp. S.PB5]
MPQQTYDLHALIYEIQQDARQGVNDAQDMARLTALVLGRLGCASGREAYDMLYEDWKALPRGTMMSGLRAGQILSVLPHLMVDQPVADERRQRELLDEARQYGPQDQSWQAGILGVSGMQALQQLGEPAELEDALARLEEARALLPPGSPQRDAIDVSHAGIRIHLAQLGGGEDDFDSAVEDLARLADSPVFDEQQRLAMAVQLAVYRSHQATRREDEADLALRIREMEAALARMSPQQMDRPNLEAYLDAARGNLAILRARRTGEDLTAADFPPAAPLDDVRRQLATVPQNARTDRLCDVGLARATRAMLAGDHVGTVEAFGLIEEAMDLLEPDDERWLRNAGTLGMGHCMLAVNNIAPRADCPHHLDQGIAWLRHTLRLSGGPEHPRWGDTGMALAMAYRFRGDYLHPRDRHAKRRNHEESRRVGLDSLRAAAWQVILQSGTVHAAETARRAGENALDVARWCIADGAHADAVRALDAGRGLALHAATVAATVPDLLAAAGQTELAEEWRRAGEVVAPRPESGLTLTGHLPVSGPSSRLRHRVLQVLSSSPLRQRLLDAPSPEEIGAALRTMGATALVYLVPGGKEEPSLTDRVFFGRRADEGQALIVSADGGTRALPLPRLLVEAPELATYRATGTPGRDAGGPPTEPTPTPPPRLDVSRAALERLCDWAGTAVMEPLLKQLPRGFGRVPSAVLVPMAELGAVPWHAARTTGRRGGHRYACQDADISYLPSARLLCEVATRPAARMRQALVVGNPTRDLHHAGEEAEAIHSAFHPQGALLGPGEATPDAITDWLRRQRGGLLHLACHGVVRQGERHSAYLALSGGELAAEELTEGTSRFRELELVVLAACRTNVSGRGYDEAYSLSTAFLVAGARSVIGSLWPVPDEATSLLMYMTHHFMSRDGLAPGPALRSAQLWMLDDRRTAPPGMPPRLQNRVRRISGADLTAWAGFTHLGW